MAQFMSQCEECAALVHNPHHKPVIYCPSHQPAGIVDNSFALHCEGQR